MPLKFLSPTSLEEAVTGESLIMSSIFLVVSRIGKAGENKLKIIPVIDVLDGIVVHAVRGRRKEYHPLKSLLCASTDPVDVAAALKALGFHELYMADLDAITGGHPNLSLFKRVADETGLESMVDAGITSLETAERLLESHVSKVVIGTETLPSTSLVAQAVELFGGEKIVVSLDLLDSQVLSRFDTDTRAEPIALLHEFLDMGVSQIIALDLARVGSGEGVNMPFLREVLKNTTAKVLVGGGVRDVKDLVELKDLGVFGVLVATALHSRKISVESLKQAGLL